MWSRLFVYEADAQQYENLFIKIMGAYKKGFQPVKPHGNIGDRGNDGWVKDEGIYYQVYAPEDITKNSLDSLNKAKDDFTKLKAYWDKISQVKEYYFVVNDKYKGVGPHISNLLAEIKITHGLEKTGLILAQNLGSYFHSLAPEQKTCIIPLLESENKSKNIYLHLANTLLKVLDIDDWSRISENLIANSIEHNVLDNFYQANLLIQKTQLVAEYPQLNKSVTDLSFYILELVEHFNNNTHDINGKFLKLDKSWRQTWVDNFEEQYQRDELWTQELYKKHNNFVYSFNKFSENMRNFIEVDFYNGRVISIVDSLGVYNEMQNSEYLPQGIL